jgi:hypothetical protein
MKDTVIGILFMAGTMYIIGKFFVIMEAPVLYFGPDSWIWGLLCNLGLEGGI